MSKKTKKTSDKIFNALVVFAVVVGTIALVLYIYNTSVAKKAIDKSVNMSGYFLNARTEYMKKTDRIVAEIYDIKNERELYNRLKDGLPNLAIIGRNKIVNLLSIRVYYGGSKEDAQFFNIRFEDIDKIEWSNVRNFDDLITISNRYLK